MFIAGQGQLLLTTCPNIESLGFKRIPHKPTNGPICRFFLQMSTCPVNQAPKNKGTTSVLACKSIFQNDFRTLKRGYILQASKGGLHCILTPCEMGYHLKALQRRLMASQEGGKSAGEVDELYYKRKISSSLERSSLMISDVYYSGSRFKILSCRCVKMCVSSYFSSITLPYLFLDHGQPQKMCSHIENMKQIRNPIQF